MRTQQWLTEREIEWQRLETLLKLSKTRLNTLSPENIRELGLLYRAIINDLSRVRSSTEHRHLEPYLNNLAQRCHAIIYAEPPARLLDIGHYFLVSFPQCFRRNFAFIFAAFATFVLGGIVAAWTIWRDPSTQTFFLPPPIIEELKNGVLWIDAKSAAPSESTFLMTNNIRVAINAYAGGVLLGVGTLLLMFHNGMFALGGPLQICFLYGDMGNRLLQFILPHGVIELTTIFIAGGAGMMVGYALLFPGGLPRWTAVRLKAWESLVLIMGCFPLLVMAGIIEGMVSLNPNVGLTVRLTVSALSAVFLFGYLGFSGSTTPGSTLADKAEGF